MFGLRDKAKGIPPLAQAGEGGPSFEIFDASYDVIKFDPHPWFAGQNCLKSKTCGMTVILLYPAKGS